MFDFLASHPLMLRGRANRAQATAEAWPALSGEERTRRAKSVIAERLPAIGP